MSSEEHDIERSCSRNRRARKKAYAAHKRYAKYHGDLPTVSFAELGSLPPETVLVDVRTPAEVATSRMPGSVTAADFAARRASAAPDDPAPPVVAVCTIGLRAALWARDLVARHAYPAPVYISQGVLLHALDGGEMVRDTVNHQGAPTWESVQELHVFDSTHRFVPDGWKATAYSTPRALWHAVRVAPELVRALKSSRRA